MTRFPLAAALLLAAGPVLAEAHEEEMGRSRIVPAEEAEMLTSELVIGAKLYSVAPGQGLPDRDSAGDQDIVAADDWEQVGDIVDIVLSRDGSIGGLKAEVGGWLGLGGDMVVFDLAELRKVGTAETLGFVTDLTPEELESRAEAGSDW
ncbi:hypothetical protein [Limimaricola pyoseonensis]|uniref:PRC-barrel domain-containing protein n=1 Tax=Limimaricola pyoseonensis TaxID=521013 RepID=A0A1G7CKL7_9RHOB|nr:hypothetical protein [Limimaricola pyoseonensis]SDE39892.1 hypothetical protein SAMN04488567_1541 [Limimaricola pyoseonensis]